MKTVIAKGKKYNSFIQTGDIHIGESRNYAGYLERHRDVLWQILDITEKNKSPLLISGDLFHRNDTKHDELKLAYDWLAEIEERKIPAVLTIGNHDHIEGTKTQLDPLMNMPFKYIKIVTWEPQVVEIGNIGIIALSWQDYTETQIEEIVTRLLPIIHESEHKIVMCHEFMYGSVMDNGKIIAKGEKLPRNLPQVNYWAVGDIHKHQPAGLPNAWYAGSPLQFKFDDVREKGVIKVNLPFLAKPEFIQLKFKPFIVVDSVDQMNEDAYYYLKADAQTVIDASKDKRIVRAEWTHKEQKAMSLSTVSITDGLTDILAGKGLAANWQQKGIEFVNKIVGNT
jgi:DNA repair exonuclease SbcCD nuclease subunit